jgi:hypothetical protein
MGNLLNKVKEFAHRHDDKVDQGIRKVGDQADQRTGGKHTEHIDKGVDAAQQHTGEGDTQR